MIRKIGRWKPSIDGNAIIDETAIIMGNVSAGKAFIFPHAMIRADEHKVVIEDNVAILDKAFIEAHSDVLIESGAIISHAAVIHGGRIGRGALIGIGAIILGADVGRESIVAAGSVVKNDVEERSMVAGIPARKVRDVNEKDVEEIKKMLEEIKQKAKWL